MPLVSDRSGCSPHARCNARRSSSGYVAGSLSLSDASQTAAGVGRDGLGQPEGLQLVASRFTDQKGYAHFTDIAAHSGNIEKGNRRVRQDQRTGLERVGKLLLLEMKPRGLAWKTTRTSRNDLGMHTVSTRS